MALIKEITEVYSARVKAKAENLGIKNAYRPLLTALAIKDGDTQLSLVGRTGLKAPTVSIILRKMEREGLVNRQTDENDLRKTHVFLTEKGKEANGMLLAGIDEAEHEMFAALSDEEYAAFFEMLKRIKG